MGVEREDYAFYGWKLPYKMKDAEGNKIQWDAEPFNQYPAEGDDEGYAIITDGMNGEYAVFGQLLHKVDNENGEGWEMVELSMSKLVRNYDNDLIQRFTDLFIKLPDSPPKVLIFSHYH